MENRVQEGGSVEQPQSRLLDFSLLRTGKDFVSKAVHKQPTSGGLSLTSPCVKHHLHNVSPFPSSLGLGSCLLHFSGLVCVFSNNVPGSISPHKMWFQVLTQKSLNLPVSLHSLIFYHRVGTMGRYRKNSKRQYFYKETISPLRTKQPLSEEGNHNLVLAFL